MFIVVAYIVSTITNFIQKRLTGEKIDLNPHHYVKRTLIHHFMNTVNFNVDIYAITFVSYSDLDERDCKSRTEDANQEPLLPEQTVDPNSQEEIILENSEVEANKNFSNSAFIFLI